MKFTPFAVLALATLLAACSSLDNPFAGLNLFGTGRDARVYNAQTGEFEWPQDSTQARRAKTPMRATTAAPTPPKTDGRYYDAQKGEWVDPPLEGKKRAPEKKTAARGAATTPAPSFTLSPQPTPTPPPPARASGVYNSSTGRIDWNNSGAPPAPTPKPKKRWWLF